MKRSTSAWLTVAWLSIAAGIAACSSDHPDAVSTLGSSGAPGSSGSNASSSGTSSSSSSSSSSSGSSGVDSGGEDAGLCGNIELPGTGILERKQVDPAPPAFGGAPTPGTYHLTDRVLYEADGTTVGTVARRGTLIVTATTMQRRVVDDTGSDNASADDYTVKDITKLELTGICPEPFAKLTREFSAQSSNLTLYIDSKHVEIYALQ